MKGLGVWLEGLNSICIDLSMIVIELKTQSVNELKKKTEETFTTREMVTF